MKRFIEGADRCQVTLLPELSSANIPSRLASRNYGLTADRCGTLSAWSAS
jgi:hypothetical protein